MYTFILEIYNTSEDLAASIECEAPRVPIADELLTWPASASPAIADTLVLHVNHKVNGLGRCTPHVIVKVNTELAGASLLGALGITSPNSN